jgi:uncharacterized protein YyaL (SSP411 family)
LSRVFKADGLYISAHDADTEHVEGATYLWSYEQLKEKLLPEELSRFSETFYISKSGNFEGLNHLIIKNDTALNGIEDKLLSIRKSRKQPTRDDKILSGVNALVAVGMIQAGRLLNKSSLEENAAIVVHNIMV